MPLDDAINKSHPVKILERRKDGGMLIEIPILRMAKIDLSRTPSPSNKKVKLGEKEFEQILANFPKFRRPVPVRFDNHDSAPGVGSDAFMERIRSVNETILAAISLSPSAVAAAMDGDFLRYRAFSGELNTGGLRKPDGDFTGAVVTGGIFTNNPALGGLHFGGAESDDSMLSCSINLSARLEDCTMATAPKKTEETNEQFVALQAENSKLKEAKLELESRLEDALVVKDAKESDNAGTIAQLQDNWKKAEARLEEVTNKSMGIEIRAIAEKILETKNVSATMFEGLDDDPVAWMKGRGFSSPQQIEAFCSDIADRSVAPVKTGEVEKGGGEERAQLTDKMRKAIELEGWDADAFMAGDMEKAIKSKE